MSDMFDMDGGDYESMEAAAKAIMTPAHEASIRSSNLSKPQFSPDVSSAGWRKKTMLPPQQSQSPGPSADPSDVEGFVTAFSVAGGDSMAAHSFLLVVRYLYGPPQSC